MPETTLPIDEVLSALAKAGVVIRDRPAVAGHVTRNPDLLGLLRPVGDGLLETYGENSQVCLIIHPDYDADGEETLDFVVRRHSYEVDFMSDLLMESSRYNHLMDTLARDSWLGIMTDLEPPYPVS